MSRVFTVRKRVTFQNGTHPVDHRVVLQERVLQQRQVGRSFAHLLLEPEMKLQPRSSPQRLLIEDPDSSGNGFTGIVY